MKFKLRKPQIRVTKKGVRVSNVGASIGGRKARINLSRKGVSTTIGTRGVSLNSRRGLTISPFSFLAGLFGGRRRKK